VRRGILLFLAISCLLLACGLLSPATESPPTLTHASITEPTTTPVDGASLLEAWQVALAVIEPWADDAQMSEEFACQGVLTSEGRCNEWYAVLVSAKQGKVAELVVAPGRAASVSPVSAPLERYREAAFSPDGMLDSPEAVRAAWDWLGAKNLQERDTRLTGLALRAGLGAANLCGISPAYQVTFTAPQGSVCLDPATARVVANTYGR
jgi:hypothetical protein